MVLLAQEQPRSLSAAAHAIPVSRRGGTASVGALRANHLACIFIVASNAETDAACGLLSGATQEVTAMEKRMSPLHTLFQVAVVCLCGSAAAGAAPIPQGGAIGKAGAVRLVVARLSKLRNFEATYLLDTDFTPDRAARAIAKRVQAFMAKTHPGMTFGPAMSGNYRYACRISVHGNFFHYEKKATGKQPTFREVQAAAPGRIETLVYPHSGAPMGGAIWTHAAPLDSLAITSAVGLRDPSRRYWLWIRRRDIAKMAYRRLGNGRFSLTQKGTRGYEYTWVFRAKPALELVALTVSVQFPHAPRSVCLRGEFSRFRTVHGVELPGRVDEAFYAGRNIPDPVRSDLLTHIRYTLDSAANTPRGYYVVWPKGCTVIDERIDRIFHITAPTTLSDGEIYLRLKNSDGKSAR